MLIVGPTQVWHMYINSPRAVSFIKLIMEMCGDVMVYFIIAGVVIALEIISIMEGTELINTMHMSDRSGFLSRKNASFTISQIYVFNFQNQQNNEIILYNIPRLLNRRKILFRTYRNMRYIDGRYCIVNIKTLRVKIELK